jgi:hypothetical protein
MKIFFLITALFFTLPLFSQGLQVARLSCDYHTDPVGVERTNPALAWQLKAADRGVLQSAYHILVADDPALLQKNTGNIWDSKMVSSDASIQIPYGGKKLESAKTYYWKVQVWDNKKRTSGWSKAAKWQMGILSQADWKGARWIAYEAMNDTLKIIPAEENRGSKTHQPLNDVLPLMRKTFSIRKAVKKATLFMAGLGHFELSVNGKKCGDHFLDAGWTQYDKEALYVPFDITTRLRQGTNAIGVLLGNGFYFIPRDRRYRKLTGAFGFPKMISRMLIEYQDGSVENIISDASWKTSASPVTYTSIYGGEDYNANLEQKNWNMPVFSDRGWRPVVLVEGVQRLIAQVSDPLKVMEQFQPKKVTKIRDSVFVFDLGQNASAIPQIMVKGKKGDTVRIVPAELLNEDGTVNQRATGSPHYYDYVLKGEGIETWQPRFTFYGFRYIQVERVSTNGEKNPGNLPVVMGIKGLHIRSAAKRMGQFLTSSDLFNRTNTLIDWGIKSNFMSVLTDCPHREKLGWLEQVYLMGSSVQYNYDALPLFRKTIGDMMTAQTAEGLVPEIAPEYVHFYYGDGMFRDSPEWGSCSIILPWYLYQWYGDKQLLTEAYPMMQRYLDYLQTKAKGNILSQGLGDWYDLGPNRPGVSQLTPMGITGTATYYYDLNIMNAVATLLGKEEEAAAYRKRAGAVKDSFNRKFYNQETRQYGTGSQTANAMAVYMNLVEPENREAVIENIIQDIRSRNNSLTTGDIGYRYLLKVLDEAGRSDVIFDMNSRTDVPGYGYQLVKGATALTESWQALPTVSNNHLMLGHLMEWFYAGLGGIGQDEQSIAFKKICIRPQVVGDITHAKASYDAPYGTIMSEWKKKGNAFELDVVIPANATATIVLPASADAKITEGNKALDMQSGMRMVRKEKDKAWIEVGSGTYHFRVDVANNQQRTKP